MFVTQWPFHMVDQGRAYKLTLPSSSRLALRQLPSNDLSTLAIRSRESLRVTCDHSHFDRNRRPSNGAYFEESLAGAELPSESERVRVRVRARRRARRQDGRTRRQRPLLHLRTDPRPRQEGTIDCNLAIFIIRSPLASFLP